MARHPASGADDLEIAKAQLGLDSDELADAQQDLARASGDERTAVQQELAAHEAVMRKFDGDLRGDGEQVAVLSVSRYSNLAGRLRAWTKQRTCYQLVQEAARQAQTDASELVAEHNRLEAQANAASGPSPLLTPLGSAMDHAAQLADLRQRSEQRQLLSIYDDRIQTQQQLAAAYRKWGAQVLLQHRIVLHLLLRSLAMVIFILVAAILCEALICHLTVRPALDRRRVQTLRTILVLSARTFAVLLILLVIFGAPRQMPTILGIATAGLTVVLQDFILAFFGWFVLMGKNGICAGDWVEINGVAGEVIDISLFRTTMLETGNWTDKGYPTGRRVTFINNFAIRGQYFNFSTVGQWMWDELLVSVPLGDDSYASIELIHRAVLQETERDSRLAEQEWKRTARQSGLSEVSSTPSVSLRPSPAGIDLLVRYVTRASKRFEVRNRLYERAIDVLHKRSTFYSAVEQGPQAGELAGARFEASPARS